MLVDSHCHLDFPDFAGEHEALLSRARDAGVEHIVTISIKMSTFPNLLELTRGLDGVSCSVGIHPHYASSEAFISAEALAKHTEDPNVVAIGEAGLDYYYDKSTPQDQAAGLREHIRAARMTGLPVVIHARDADDDMGDLLEEEYKQGGAFPGLLHCFSSGQRLAERGLALGLYLSFSGIVTFKNATNVHEVAKGSPSDRILVETDAPYLAPAPYRGKRNEPAFVRDTAKYLAELRGVDFEMLSQQTTENFYRLFHKVPKPSYSQSEIS